MGLEIDRLSAAERPSDRPIGFQRWRHLLFLHWEVDPGELRAVLPEGLDIDTYEGRAFVGVVPFTMLDVAPSWAPAVPGISDFHELNVRTYVHQGGKNPGVWFFSLDAASSVAVLAARAAWSLPYHRARMRMHVDGDMVHYTSRRRFAGSRPAEIETRYRIGDHLGAATPGTFEHFLAERYFLYVERRGRLRIGQVHHRPYPLQRAEVLALRETMVSAAGLSAPAGEPHALYAAGVDVDVFRLRDP